MTTETYDKKPKLPAGLKLEGDTNIPAPPSGLVLDSEKKSKVGGDVLGSDGRSISNKVEPFPLLYKREKEQPIASDIRTPQQKAGSKMPEQKTITAGFTQVATPKKDETFKVEITDKEAEQKALDSFKSGEHLVDEKSDDPVGDLSQQINIKKYSYPEYKVARKKIELINEGFFRTGEEAKRYLERNLDKSSDNATKQLAEKKFGEYKLVEDAVNDSSSLEEAAVKLAASKGDEQVKYLMEKTGGNLIGSTDETSPLPMAMRGEKLLQLLMDKNLAELADNNPQLKTSIKEELFNFPVRHPEYATKLLVEAIANKRDEKGLNSSFANIVSKETTDKIVDELIKDGTLPGNYKFLYEKEVRPKLGTWQSIGRGIGNAIPGINQLVNEAPIPTPGILESFEQGFENTQVGIAKSIVNLPAIAGLPTLTDAFQPREQQTFNVLKKQFETPAYEPSKLRQKVAMHGGNMMAFIAGLTGGTAALRGLNLVNSPGLANATMMILATHGDNTDAAKALFPRNDFKQHVYIATMDGLNAAMGKFLPGQNIPRLLKGGEKPIGDVLKKMVDGEITTSAAKNQIMEWFGNTAKSTLGGAEFMGAIGAADDMLTQVLEGKKLNLDQTFEKGWEGFKLGLISTPLLAGTEAALKSNKGFREQIISIAEDPNFYKKLAEVEAGRDPEFAKIKDDVVQNIDYVGKVLEELGTYDMSEKDKQKYVLNSLTELIKQTKAEKATDPTIKKKLQSEIKDLNEVKDAALNGIPEEKVKLNQAIRDVKELYTEDFLSKGAKEMLESKKTEEGEPKFDEGKVNSFLKFLAQQANNITGDGKFNEGSDARKSVEKQYPSQLIELANEMFPEYKKTAEDFDAAKEQPKQESGVSVIMPGEIKQPETTVIKPKGAAEGVVPSTLDIPKDLEQKGEQVESNDDAKRRFSEGERIFAFDELTERPVELRSVEQMDKYAPDQLLAYPEQQTTPISETKETTQVPIETETTSQQPATPTETIPPTTEGGGSKEARGEPEMMRLAHEDTRQIYEERGLPERLETPTKHREQLEKEADEILRRGYDFNRVAEETMSGNRKWGDTDQVLFARKVADLIAKQNTTDIQSPEFDRLQNEIEKLSRASDVAGTIGARFLESRKGYRPVAESLSDYITIEKESLGVEELTPMQKGKIKKEYDDLQKAKDEFEAYRAKKEDDINKKQAEAEFNKTKSTAKKTKKTHEDFVSERKSLKEELAAARKEHEDWLKEQGIQKAGFGSLTGKEAKVIAKYVKSYAEEGIAKLEEVVSKVFEEVKGVIPNIEERDIRDVIAGAYAEKKKTRNELAATLVDFKREQVLINKLDALFKEAEPTTEKKKIERNQKIADLKKQIKDIQSFEKEVAAEKESIADKKAKDAESTSKQVDKAEKEIDKAEEKARKQKQIEQDRELKRQQVQAERERKRLEREFEKEKRDEEKAIIKSKLDVARQLEKDLSYRTPEEKALDTRKSNIRKGIEKVEEQIKKGDFAPPEKKQPIKLDAEGHKLRDKFMQLKQQRDARVVLNQRMSETGKQKGMRIFTEVMGIPRTLMTIGDFSALLRQNIFFTVGHPLMTARASGEMFKSAFSQKHYDRWFADLKDTQRYQIMQDSKLAIADSLSHDLTKREEEFMSTIAEKLPIVGNMTIKGVPVGLNIVKGSERSYTMLLNKMRVDMFDALAAKMEDRGLTFENSPKQYKALAEYINNATGRSDFGKTLNRIAPVLNNTFFSPRLIASRVNMLTYWAQPRFWKTLPREAKIDYFRNWLSLLGTGMIILGLAKWGGADVEDDPRSSDFGKIKDGDTRWDIWGGAQPYVRVLAQIGFGERKSTKSGEIYELNGDDIFGETKGGVAADFLRNKLAPVPGAAVDILSGRTGVGDKIVYQWGGEEGKEISISEYIRQRLLPMTITGTQEALKDQGLKALITVGIPNTFGIGTQTYDANSPTSKQDIKQSNPQKSTKSD